MSVIPRYYGKECSLNQLLHEKYVDFFDKYCRGYISTSDCLLNMTKNNGSVIGIDKQYMSRVMRKLAFAYAKTKPQISCAVTALLISTFVFATSRVQSLFYLNPKFQASSHLLWLYSSVCQHWSETPKTGFLMTWLIVKHDGPIRLDFWRR